MQDCLNGTEYRDNISENATCRKWRGAFSFAADWSGTTVRILEQYFFGRKNCPCQDHENTARGGATTLRAFGSRR